MDHEAPSIAKSARFMNIPPDRLLEQEPRAYTHYLCAAQQLGGADPASCGESSS